MLDRQLVEDVAFRLNTDAALVEKDWHVVRALGVISALDHQDIVPAFSGGTSLSKGWQLIKRFSEDIDFKLAMPASESRSKDRTRRKAYRSRTLAALSAAGFEPVGEVLKGNEDRFFSANFMFRGLFETVRGLRPHIRIEMTFDETALPPVARPIQSLIGQAQNIAPEISSFLCVDPIETAADKLSALAWRVCTRERGAEDDDPTIIRHLHDLAALASYVSSSEAFANLVQQAALNDTGRGGGKVPNDATSRFVMMFERLRGESFWSDDYSEYVRAVSYAKPDETLSFNDALDALTTLMRGFDLSAK